MRALTCLIITACVLAACTSHSLIVTTGDDDASSKAEKNRLIALKCNESLSSHDVDATLAYCSADFIDYGTGEDKPITNIDTLRKDLRDYVAAFPDLKADNLNAFAHGDTVVVLARWSGTFKSDYMGVKANGKKLSYDEADVFTFTSDGKVKSHRSTQAMATFFTQLGINPPAK